MPLANAMSSMMPSSSIARIRAAIIVPSPQPWQKKSGSALLRRYFSANGCIHASPYGSQDLGRRVQGASQLRERDHLALPMGRPLHLADDLAYVHLWHDDPLRRACDLRYLPIGEGPDDAHLQPPRLDARGPGLPHRLHRRPYRAAVGDYHHLGVLEEAALHVQQVPVVLEDLVAQPLHQLRAGLHHGTGAVAPLVVELALDQQLVALVEGGHPIQST